MLDAIFKLLVAPGGYIHCLLFAFPEDNCFPLQIIRNDFNDSIAISHYRNLTMTLLCCYNHVRLYPCQTVHTQTTGTSDYRCTGLMLCRAIILQHQNIRYSEFIALRNRRKLIQTRQQRIKRALEGTFHFGTKGTHNSVQYAHRVSSVTALSLL